MSDFTHLHLNSSYSINEGLMSPKEIVELAKTNNMTSVAITDASNMYGAIKFYKAAKSAGIKPIIGAEVNILPKYQRDEDGKIITDESYTCVLLAKNNQGYRSLMEIISRGYTDGLVKGSRKNTPYVEESYIAERSNGLFMLSGGIDGVSGKNIKEGKYEAAKKSLLYWKNVFKDNFFIEINRTGMKVEDEYISPAVNIAIDMDIPIVASNKVKFSKRADYDNHELRVSIQEGENIEARGYNTTYSPHQYFKTTEEMEALFHDIPEAIKNTKAIEQACNVEIELDKPSLPRFPTPKGESESEYLEKMSRDGLRKRLDIIMREIPKNEREIKEKPYWDRLETEIDVINNMGFPGYFLIVADFIQWSKRNDIPVGPGRGSGAGSIIAYACEITDIDPLPYDLLFERFLNPERVSMPDFDVDFCMDRRDEVIDYVKVRYGDEAVSQISTFGRMAAKASIKDVARAKGYSYTIGDNISKMIPHGQDVTIKDSLATIEVLRDAYDQRPEVKDIIDKALILEGLPKSVGKHAGGVLISPSKISDYSPITSDEDGIKISQYYKDDVESVGLVKFDFLGLRNLTTIHLAIKNVNKKRESLGQEPLSFSSMGMDDPKTFESLKNADTTGVFQLESSGMKALIKNLQPDNFEDIIALVALYRPGPLQSGMVEDFVDRKHGRKTVEYPHPVLEDILKPTYGVIVYQEQVMQIAQKMAGYSLGQADLLRRAMGKKKPEEMEKQRNIFIDGAINQGIEKEKATEVFDLMEYFSGYGFNKSHSAAYAVVTYQTAYLKTHYPAEFMSAVMTNNMDNDKNINFFSDFAKYGNKVLPPHINKSGEGFLPTNKGNILFGLRALKGIGDSACSEIIKERDRNGPYKDLFEFSERVSSKVGKTAFIGLINSGAMDCFKVDRNIMLESVENATKWRKKVLDKKKTKNGEQIDIEQLIQDRPSYTDAPVSTMKEKLDREVTSMGTYLSGHPLDEYQEEIESAVTAKNIDIDLDKHGFKESDPKHFVQVGVVVKAEKKKNMTFFELDDKTGVVKCSMFKGVSSKYGDRIQVGSIICVRGRLAEDKYTEMPAIGVKSIMNIQELRETHAKQTVIKGNLDILNSTEVLNILEKQLNENSPGYSKLLILSKNNDGTESVFNGKFPTSIVPNENMINILKSKGLEVEVKYEGKELDVQQFKKVEKNSQEPVYSREEVIAKVKEKMKRVSDLLQEAQIEKGSDVRKDSLKRKLSSNSPSPR